MDIRKTVTQIDPIKIRLGAAALADDAVRLDDDVLADAVVIVDDAVLIDDASLDSSLDDDASLDDIAIRLELLNVKRVARYLGILCWSSDAFFLFL